MHEPFPSRATAADPRRRHLLGSAAALAATPWLALAGGCTTTGSDAGPGLAKPQAPRTGAPGPAPALDRDDLALVNRVSWGASAATAADFARRGRTAWLESQLHPQPARLPVEVQTQIDAMSISTTSFQTLVAQMDGIRRDKDQKAKDATDPAAKQAAQQEYQQALTKVAREAASRSLLRAVYSPNQLQEQMTWFWFNHFNVHQYKANLRVLVGDYEDQALRPRALGRFRDLLIASATHPAMIRYLDNEQNAAGRINENYAREVMELHTLGVDGGYSQKDVQELARVLTGVGINVTDKTPNLRPQQRDAYVRMGFTEFNPNRHDFGQKLVLGRTIEGRGWNEVLDELGRLAAHPATARFICTQLAQYIGRRRAAAGAGRHHGAGLPEERRRHRRDADGDVRSRATSPPRSAASSRIRCTTWSRPCAWPTTSGRSRTRSRCSAGSTGSASCPTTGRRPTAIRSANRRGPSPGQMSTRFEIARAIGTGSAGLFRAEGATVDAPGVPAAGERLLLPGRRADAERLDPRGAGPLDLAAGVERVPPVVPRIHAPLSSAKERSMQRREFIRRSIAAGAVLPLAAGSATLLAAPDAPARVLVVFLRGGYDAASLLVPTSSSFYYEQRPNIAVARPGSAADAALPLDADWGLQSVAARLHAPLFEKKQAAFVPFAGTDDTSRSHFETQDSIELGQALQGHRDFQSGFMNRLAAVLGARDAIAFTDQLPLCFRGSMQVPNLALVNMAKPGIDARQSDIITAMYQGSRFGSAVGEGFQVRTDATQALAGEMVAANRNAITAKGFEGEARRIGRLMRERYRLGFVDVGGWDTHVGQGNDFGA